jgi:toxin ParE1/3/4
LTNCPAWGAKCRNFDDVAVRELSLYSYRTFYEIKTTHIDIQAVIHKRRELQAEEILREP